VDLDRPGTRSSVVTAQFLCPGDTRRPDRLSLLFFAVSVATLATFLLVLVSRTIIVWAAPSVRQFMRRGADAFDAVIAKPLRVLAVPRFRWERLKWNDKYKVAYSRFAVLRPSRVSRADLRVVGRALTVGLTLQTRMSRRLGNGLTEKVSYSDLIHLASRSRSQVRAHSRRHRRTTA